MTRDDHNRQFRIDLLRVAQQLHAVHAFHLEVGHQHARKIGRHIADRLCGTPKRFGWKPPSCSHCSTACRIDASSSTNRIGPNSGMSTSRRDCLRHERRQIDDHFRAAFGTIGGADVSVKSCTIP